MDEDAVLAVGVDGAAMLIGRKTDADNPLADSDLHATPVVIDARDLVHGDAAPVPSVLGADLPGLDLEQINMFGRNFDFGLKFSNDKLPILGTKLPVVGGKGMKFELDLRLLGGAREGNPEYTGFEGYDTATVLRAEMKLSVKLFDMVTITGYLQGMFMFGARTGVRDAETDFIGGRLVVGLQGKLESPPATNGIATGTDGEKYGAQLGIVFDVRLQSNSNWRPAPSGEAASPIEDFARLVRISDGSPARVGDNPAETAWQLDVAALAPMILDALVGEGGLDAAGIDPAVLRAAEPGAGEPEGLGTILVPVTTEAAPAAGDDGGLGGPPLAYSHNLSIAPGLGGYGKAVFGSAVELKASLIVYADLVKPDGGDFGFNGVRIRLDFEGKFGPVTMRVRLEWVPSLTEGEEPRAFVYRDHDYDWTLGTDAPTPDALFADVTGGDLTNDGAASIAMAEDGRIAMAWVKDAPNDSGDLSYVMVSESTDGGRSWSAPEQVPGGAGLNFDPVVAYDAAGRIVVSWNQGEGAMLASQPPGRAYVVFGGAAALAAGSLELASLDGTDGYALEGGAAMSAIGAGVTGAGDLNGDGVADLALGAPDAEMDAGRVYVTFGGAQVGAAGAVDLDALDGTNGFVLEGAADSALGAAVQRLGDVNGDGVDDLMVSAPGADGSAGATYVIFGGAQGFGAGGRLSVADLDGTNGFRLATGEALDGVGASLGGGADVNGDGIADLVVGAPGAGGGAGAYYVVYGGAGLGASGALDLGALNGTNGFAVRYSAESAAGQPVATPMGSAAATVGDLDGDGVGDLAFGSEGQAFVAFGGAGVGAGGALDLFRPGARRVLTLDGRAENGFSPISLADAGDVNGDGIDDLVAGEGSGGEGRRGESWLLFGARDLGSAGRIDLAELAPGAGLRLNGAEAGDAAGAAVGSAGDVNGDGVVDIVIGAPQLVNAEDFDAAIEGSRQSYAVKGETWSEAQALQGAPAGAKTGGDLARLSDGRLLLTWVAGETGPEETQQLFATFWNGTGWSAPAVVATGNIAQQEKPQVSEAGGEVILVWTDVLPDPDQPSNDGFELRSSAWRNGSWTAAAPLAIEPSIVPTQLLTDNLALNVASGDGTSRVSVEGVVVSEAEDCAIVTIRREGDVSGELALRYATVDGSATAGADYGARDAVLRFAAGETEKILRIRLRDDDHAERRNEHFHLKLWSEADDDAYLTSGGLRTAAAAELRAKVTLVDDEPTELAAIGSGFILETDPEGMVGEAVAAAGDVNGDGRADLLIGAPGKTGGAGRTYLLWGSDSLGTADAGLSLDALDASRGVMLDGPAGLSQSGSALAAADFDRDGRADVAIGAPGISGNAEAAPGRVYVAAGATLTGRSALALSAETARELTTTTTASLAGAALATGWRIWPSARRGWSGFSWSTARLWPEPAA